MFKRLKLVIGCVALVAVATLIAPLISNYQVRQLTRRVNDLEEEKKHLQEFARRLCASRRAAQVDVLDQHTDESGAKVTTLLWQEIDEQGIRRPPQTIHAVGELVYFEGAVIKFEQPFVGDGDAERGASLVTFRRIFGDRQAPDTVPIFYQAESPSAGQASAPARLWTLFWEMMDNPELAARYGVRVVQCEAPAVRLRAGELWEITLDAPGGLNLRKLIPSPHLASGLK